MKTYNPSTRAFAYGQQGNAGEKGTFKLRPEMGKELKGTAGIA